MPELNPLGGHSPASFKGSGKTRLDTQLHSSTLSKQLLKPLPRLTEFDATVAIIFKWFSRNCFYDINCFALCRRCSGLTLTT